MKKLLLFLGFCLIVIISQAQLLDKVKVLGASYSKGTYVPTYYSNAYAPKALEIQLSLEHCLKYFQKTLRLKIDSLYLSVFNDSDFVKLNIPRPYGLPFVDGQPPVVFLPATSTGIVALQTKGLLEHLKAEKMILSETGYDLKKAIDKSVDLIGFHELGHLYSNKMGIQGKLNDIFWLKEFVASYFAYSYLIKNEPRSAKLWTIMSGAVVNSWSPENQRLEEMGSVSISNPKAYSWYQSKIITKVERVYKKEKLGFIKRLQKFCVNHENLDKHQVLSELTKKIKDIKEW